jgi:glycopeptide antibiotics resistance protein
VPNVLANFAHDLASNLVVTSPLVLAVAVAATLLAHRRGLPTREVAIVTVGTGAIALHLVAVLVATRITEALAGGVSAEPFPARQVELMPLAGIGTYVRSGLGAVAIVELAGNVLLLLPLGLLVPVVLRRDPGWRPVVALGLIASLSIETIHWGLSVGVASTDDVLLNVAGVAVGYLAYRGLRAVMGGGAALDRSTR